jgi:hypothetical protein
VLLLLLSRNSGPQFHLKSMLLAPKLEESALLCQSYRYLFLKPYFLRS